MTPYEFARKCARLAQAVLRHSLLKRTTPRPFCLCLACCFACMTSPTQRLPVVLVPHEASIAIVWNDVIDAFCWSCDSILQALNTQRVSHSIRLARLRPLTAIASGCSTTTIIVLHVIPLLAWMLSTPPTFADCQAAWMRAN